MSPQANKSCIECYYSYKILHNFKQEGYIFIFVKGSLDITDVCFLVFLSNLLIKMLLKCVTSEAIVVDKL